MARPRKYKTDEERRAAQLEQKRRSATKSRRLARELDPLEPYRGEAGTGAVLTWPDVREIRRLHRERQMTLKSLAHRFGVSEKTISDIVNFRTWRE